MPPPPDPLTGPTQPDLIAHLGDAEMWRNVVLTLVLWTIAFGLRAIVVSALRRRGMPANELRKIVASTRSGVLLVLVVGTATVWFDELKVFALSLAAVAVAVVVATKEIIMCVGGALLRSVSRAFEIGDRIEVGGLRGDVIDTTILSTTVLEIGPGRVGHQRTGRAITLPNSLFLAQAIINESVNDAYVLHTFEVKVPADARWANAEAALRAAAQETMAPYEAEARAYFTRAARDRHLDVPTLDPLVLVLVDSHQAITLTCRLPAPALRKGHIEQAIVRRFLVALHGSTEPAAETPPRAETAAPANV